MSTQASSSYGISSSSRWKYDVFLSFRGEDTRKGFTSHLRDALRQSGIEVFIDNDLERGEPISPKLLQAIEESKFSIVVLSRNYAASPWCLDELVKIVQCMNTSEHNVFPIFLDVDPSMVRNQTGTFKKALAKHDKTFDKEKVREWRNALIEVANLAGWVLKDREESEFIQNIVKKISSKSRPSSLMHFEDLVGINLRVQKLRTLIEAGSEEVRMIGICGMGGVGKTTIARVVYELISCEFEVSSFLANVREISERDGIISLQNQLLFKILGGTSNNICNVYEGMSKIRSNLCSRKVLIVIDDVVNERQLNELARKHHWFGKGSRIIVTTRDKHLLKKRMDEIYEVDLLNYEEALQLFSLKAFDKRDPLEHYRDLSKQVVKYANGLPLALEVLGSFLFDRTIDEWEDAIERLKKDSEKEILDVLQISFDGLKEEDKKIFLDIACFFKGKDINYVKRILKACGFNPSIGMGVLIDKSLMTVEDNIILMHDLLQEMGQQIVKRESLEPGKRSRLWEAEDVRHVLTKNTGTEFVEGIILEKDLHLSVGSKTFSNMINLRLLKLQNVELPEGLEYISDKLRLFDWYGYPLKSLPSNLQLDELVEIKMVRSRIEQMWDGIKSCKMLRSIHLKDCQNLMQLPDFTMVPNLENLILEQCPRLHDVHQSLLFHKKVTSLNIISCSSLTTLPNKIHMESLEELDLSGCSNLKNFPEIVGSMRCLSLLFLRQTAIEELPVSVELLTGLYWLMLEDCGNLASLPSTMNNLKSLKILNISGCFALKRFPLEFLGQVECSRASMLPTYEVKEISSYEGVSQKCCTLKKFNIPNRNPEEGSTSRLLICRMRQVIDNVILGNFVSSYNSSSEIPGRPRYLHAVPLENYKWARHLKRRPRCVDDRQKLKHKKLRRS